METPVTVVGVGADGWEGLPPPSRAAIRDAEVIIGGVRHLGLVPDTGAVREPWPSPLLSGLPAVLERHRGRKVAVLASGDPLLSGVGTTLVRLLGAERVRILPAVSSVALARARMRWSAETVDAVTLVGRDADSVRRFFTPGRRLVVLSSDGATPARVAERLVADGLGDSRMTVLADLGSDHETRQDATAAEWDGRSAPALNVVCVEVAAGGGHPVTPGLPDDAFDHDGQLTKRELRIAAVCALGPRPGALLWDVGAGAGSVAVEWLRADSRCRAVAVEQHPERVRRIARNASRLGVPSLRVVHGAAPDALAGLEPPDAVFVGGGASDPSVLDRCWSALRPGGRMVVHAVTLETEAALVERWKRHGGDLTRLAVERAAPLGTFTGWTPARPVVQWAATKTDQEDQP
ncbi:bifunctional cobalt-precorrin-7 (C(5))-methyltransferase/cobalt-precorrin-6B (C(15))-methyltransferase [Thermobifida halotolerans]|uniref:Bifunctional cobalt-precorrin-7 (C(5))-methyltransferase/cobalt-precorrin-6B (C(15))-methyltransferase n=1 Tax=Thermobifida halotolerans TaxID=483545 RepID=A0A399G120_9ACTN|nr:bifunctional cobalt-precorrin-7 (C(5))-methyltransferase/cobalt-precorrin-6B (C(15))-methyltransferase [Thermobifida halotolerans]UOE19377.1 bifunctional cobalt-precorrin-7 (C(5))-methyltransferase/cobalt-precorrin-6B (C(15))-methyltransferase [Thermobifida halotolerans]